MVHLIAVKIKSLGDNGRLFPLAPISEDQRLTDSIVWDYLPGANELRNRPCFRKYFDGRRSFRKNFRAKFAAHVDSSRQENICPIFIWICFPRFHSGEPLPYVEKFCHRQKVSWNFVVQLKIDQKFSFPAFNLFDGGCPDFH
jgi:hypothetical protein